MIYLEEQVSFRPASEWKRPEEQSKPQNPYSPHVDGATQVVGFARDLGSHVAGGAAEEGKTFGLGGLDGEAEIDQFDSVEFVHKNIFHFDVSVYNPMSMQITQCFQNLPDYIPSLPLLQPSLPRIPDHLG